LVDVSLLRQSLELALRRSPNFTTRFYDTLFRRYPSLRPMFQRSLRNVQERRFEAALRSIVEHLEDGPWLGETLRALGAKHAGYGVTREMYDWFGDALLRTLADTAGDDWGPALEESWAEAYRLIVTSMRAGEEPAAR